MYFDAVMPSLRLEAPHKKARLMPGLESPRFEMTKRGALRISSSLTARHYAARSERNTNGKIPPCL